MRAREEFRQSVLRIFVGKTADGPAVCLLEPYDEETLAHCDRLGMTPAQAAFVLRRFCGWVEDV